MPTLLQYKCPACGGALEFNSDVQKLKCPYCDTEFETEALKQLDEALKETPADQLDWSDGPGKAWQEGEAERIDTYTCQSCGGQIAADWTTAATSCPYCDNPVVMAGNLSGQLRPDLVIPFKLDKEAAKAALMKHFSGKRLLPKAFKDENHISEIKGIYVPFWLYDAEADGSAEYHATRLRTWQDSRYIYTETSHFRVFRAGNLQFTGVPVDGSTKMPDALMESLEPYDLKQAVDFQSAYLAGFLADKYDVAAAESQSRANQRIRSSLEQELASTVIGYATVTPRQSSLQLKNPKIRYALLPVWLLTTRYKDQTYLFAMNGQTGKLVGDLPVDKAAYWKWWAGIAAGVTAAAYAVAYLAHFFL